MATTTSSSSSSTAAADGPAAALDLVRPLQPLLAGFAHRNKNQHRGARWFASFAMLRRHVNKLADDAAAAAHAARPPGKKPKKKKKKNEETDPVQPRRRDEAAEGGDHDDHDGPAPRRARWLRDVLVPQCYLAFSQLAADNQFATLGVVLLGALAQVRRACVCLVGEGTEAATATAPPPASALAPTTTTTTTATTTAAAAAPTNNKPPAGARGAGEAVDVGEAVSRDALARATVGDRPPNKRKKPAAGSTPLDAGAALGDPPAPDRKEADVKPAKKKKKAKRGDEFDDLFSSLF